MATERFFRAGLRVYAFIVFLAALLHGAWYWFFPTYDEMKGFTESQWSLLFLFNWSIALLLLFMSVISFSMSRARSTTLDQLRVFTGLTVGFWICRLLLEFIFPVQIPFVIIPSPSLLLKFLIIICIIILALPEMRIRLSRSVSHN